MNQTETNFFNSFKTESKKIRKPTKKQYLNMMKELNIEVLQ